MEPRVERPARTTGISVQRHASVTRISTLLTMNQSRRKFLQTLPAAMSLPFTLAGMPVKLMEENALTKMAQASLGNDRVLIILQMHGGNDGLNCLIPVSDYELYYSKR